MIIIEPADALAPDGPMPSAGTVLTKKLHMFHFKFYIFDSAYITNCQSKSCTTSLKILSSDLNFVITGYTVNLWWHQSLLVPPKVVRATNDDMVVIMTILGFQCYVTLVQAVTGPQQYSLVTCE